MARAVLALALSTGLIGGASLLDHQLGWTWWGLGAGTLVSIGFTAYKLYQLHNRPEPLPPPPPNRDPLRPGWATRWPRW